MHLDLKLLRGRRGTRVPFSGQIPFDEADFYEPLTLHAPVQVKGWAVYLPNEVIEVELALRVELSRVCSRCAQEVAVALDGQEHITLCGTDADELLPDDYQYPLNEETVPLKPIELSLMLSQFDPKPLCKADCKGLCPGCGVNLNQAACQCHQTHDKDPRLAALAKLLDE